MRDNLYEIGPVTGIEGCNRPEFERVRRELNKAGYGAAIPHDDIPPNTPWNIAMRISICNMLMYWVGGEDGLFAENEYCGVALLDGWEDSKGATIEHDLAVALGIPCKPWREWLEVSNG